MNKMLAVLFIREQSLPLFGAHGYFMLFILFYRKKRKKLHSINSKYAVI